MEKIFYKWISNSRYLKFHHEIKRALQVIDEYKLYESPKFSWNNIQNNKNSNVSTIDSDGTSITICKTVTDTKKSYNIFIGNIQIRVEENSENKEQVYSIHIKNNDGLGWDIEKVNGEWDYSHPTNKTLRIFVWYDVPVLNIARSVGEVYQTGNWNKYVCKTLDYFTSEIEKCTDSSSFNEMYEESEWENFKKWFKGLFKKNTTDFKPVVK